MKYLIFLLSFIAVTSCTKCEKCYLVEEDVITGVKTETLIGRHCGDKIEAKENDVLTCVDGVTCSYECR